MSGSVCESTACLLQLGIAGDGSSPFPAPKTTSMRNTFNLATRVSGSRVALIAVTLIVLPSFTLSGRDRLTASGVELSAPVGVDEAAAQAVGVAPVRAAAPAVATLSPANWNQTTLGSVDPKVFELALSATRCAVKSGAVENPATLTVIDYSKPSTEHPPLGLRPAQSRADV